MTPTEGLLWQQLRGDKLGVHFRRQQIIAGFIVDFYCHAAALVVELDGGVHLQPKQAQTDLLRDEGLRQLGLRVVRFKNAEVTTRLPEVLDQIRVLRGA
jgi:very-short-patch-repair endonuclease